MPLFPQAPECAIVLRMQKTRDLPNVKRANVAAQKVPHKMKRSISEHVNQREPFSIAPVPESLEAAGAQPLSPRVPKTEMHFRCHWHLRIKIIAAPFPTGPAHHGRKVIHGQAFHSADGLVA